MAQKSDLLLALDQIEREKGVKKDEILLMVEGAIASALRKHVGKTANVVCVIDRETAEITACIRKKVSEVITDPELEILPADAQRFRKGAALGEDVDLPVDAKEFARIAAQTAKQVLIQKIREIERENLFVEFKPKEGELVSGAVHRFMERNIIIDLGKAEAILPVREQIRRERYNVGDRIRAVILKVDKAQRGPQVVLSRAASLFMRRLFEMEVPEVGEKVVEILDIARDPGFRSKIVVKSNNPKVDPVGACVGIRGSRIRSIMNELSGERIDLIPWSDDTATFIANSIAPAKSNSVRILDKAAHQAEIIVPNDQLALTIGRDGQNIRLACKLTGWSLAVKSEQQKADAQKADDDSRREAMSVLKGIGPKTSEVLIKSGLTDIHKLATLQPTDLTGLQGIGEKTAEKIIESAKEYVAENPKPAIPAAAAAPAESPETTETAEAQPAAEAQTPPAEKPVSGQE
ncbi:MAG: transcription termination factor NusA [Elusimicrobia bacterium GWA2_69_24]|nr:MAG: transcription termination factor NusA [Elusimicrobia bacterium GWA2_69_24]HBL18344.1 transcription termination/antitermination protein NusA [Elusimicrobiota bacterium]